MNEKQRQDLMLVGGILLVLAGLAALARTLSLVPPAVARVWSDARTVSGPGALILLGVLVALYATGALHLPTRPAPGARLYRSYSDRWLAGVCGGMAAYLSLDPLVVRTIFVLLTLVTGVWSGIVVYVVLATIVIPPEPSSGATHA